MGAVLLSSVCSAVPRDHFPEPGLYQIELKGTSFPGSGEYHSTHVDGRTGDFTSTHAHSLGKFTQTLKGTGQQTSCIKPYPPAEAAKYFSILPGKCRNDRITETPDALVVDVTCSTGPSTHHFRRLGPGEWEWRAETKAGTAQTATGVKDLVDWAYIRSKDAPTEAERNKAAKSLAELKVLAKNMAAANAVMAEQYRASAAKAHLPDDKARLNAMADSVGSVPFPASTHTVRLRKIADTCE